MSALGNRRRFVIHAFASLAASAGAGCKHHDAEHAAPAPARTVAPVAADPMPRAPTPPQVPSVARGSDASGSAADAGVAARTDGGVGIFAALGRMGAGGDAIALGGSVGLGQGIDRPMGRMGGSLRASRSNGPLVRAAPPSVMGLLSPEAVRRVALRNIGQVAHCHEQGLARNPNADGRIVIRFIIGGTGEVLGANVVESSYPIADVGQCIAQAVRRWRFPSPEGGGIVTVNYPFNLQHPE